MASEKRLISIELWEEFKNEITKDLDPYDQYDSGYEDALERADDWLFCQPEHNAVEVVHGRWENIRNFGSGECYGWCSHCKTPVKADNATGLVQNNRFCHWCGAKMDGDGNGSA